MGHAHGPINKNGQREPTSPLATPAISASVLVVLVLFWRYCAKILTVGAVLVVLTSIRTNFVGETK